MTHDALVDSGTASSKVCSWEFLSSLSEAVRLHPQWKMLLAIMNSWDIPNPLLRGSSSGEELALLGKQLHQDDYVSFHLLGFPVSTLSIWFVTYCGVQLIKERERILAIKEETCDKAKVE